MALFIDRSSLVALLLLFCDSDLGANGKMRCHRPLDTVDVLFNFQQ